jgi:hypothetical protein
MTTNHVRLILPESELEPIPITAYQFDILIALERDGRMKAFNWKEDEVDELFKMRPRLIRLVPGYEDPIIDITMEGRKRLQLERTQGD